MSKLRWLLILLAAATAAGLTQLWILQGQQTVESLLASAHARLGEEEADYDGALQALERALDLAGAEGAHDDFARDLLLMRAGVFRARSRNNAATRRYDTGLARIVSTPLGGSISP